MTEIKAIGFDLDQTLYPKSPEIDSEIQKYIYEKIAENKKCSIEEAEFLFKQHYPEISGRQTLKKLGIPKAAEVVQEALERADLTPWLKPDIEVKKLLEELKKKYDHISLITGSHKNICGKKLEAIGLKRELFDLIICSEIPKSDGSAFRKWMEEVKKNMPEIQAENFLYVGDRHSTDAEVPLKLGMKAVLVNVPRDDKIDVPQFSRLTEIRTMLL